jgi:serine/threonine-protein kinase
VVFGRLVSAGADSVVLTATILDVPGPNVIAEIEMRAQADRMDRVADSLTVRVLRELGRTRAIGVVRSAPLGSRSMPALKAFLQGEQFLRRSDWDSAVVYDQRAISLDSGFTLAWSHAGLAAGWQHAANDSLSRTYKLRAGAMNHGLAPRESLIVQAESLAATVYEGPAQLAGRWWTYGKRLIATLDEAVRRYPNDPELWYMLGDARFHAGSLAGLPARASLDAFDRAIELDSAFTPSYVHAIPLGLDYRGTEAGRRYATAFLAAGAMGSYAQSTDLVLRLMDPATRAPAIRYLADSASSHVVQTVWLAIGRWLDSAETVVAMVRARVDAEQKAGKKSNVSVFMLPSALAARGHVKEAATRTTFPGLLAQYALVGAMPPDSAARMARRWIDSTGDGLLFAGPLLAAVHDTAGIAAALRKIEAVQRRPPPNLPPIAKDFLNYAIASQRAYLALARGDSAAALRLFDARPDTASYGAGVLDDLVHAQLLALRGRASDAATLLARPPVGFNPGMSPLEILRALESGRVYEQLGNRDRAIEGYSFVVRAWRNPDPELQPFVNEAHEALRRLSGEPQKTGS